MYATNVGSICPFSIMAVCVTHLQCGSHICSVIYIKCVYTGRIEDLIYIHAHIHVYIYIHLTHTCLLVHMHNFMYSVVAEFKFFLDFHILVFPEIEKNLEIQEIWKSRNGDILDILNS